LHSSLAKVMRCDRKACYGYNLQAAANHKCEFIFASVNHFASVHDGRAFRETPLWRKLEEGYLQFGGKFLPGDLFLLGGNAYPLRPFILHPWKGSPTLGGPADCFNFYQATARCAIERAFGQMVLRWQRIHQGIQVRKARHATDIIRAACCLHNLCKRMSSPVPYCPVGGPATPTASSRGSLHNMTEAQERVRELSLHRTPEPRQNHDRRVDVVQSVELAKQKRQEIAHELLGNGMLRPGVAPRFNMLCPGEDEQIANSLDY
jgi:hypothetical protein